MPINLDHFFQHVSTLDDSLQFHVSASQDLAQGTALHGLKKLSSDARAVENQAAVRAFVQSLSQNPVYGALLDRVRTPLDALVKAGKPLTAGVVKQTQLALNVILASQVGTSLVNGGQLPADHGAAFGQFAALHGMPLGTEAEKSRAVREYLLTEVCDKNIAALTTLPDMGEKSAAAKKIMDRLHEPLSGRNGFLGVALNQALSQGLDKFQFSSLTSAYARACEADLHILQSLNRDAVNSLASKPDMPAIMSALRDALPAIGEGQLDLFRIRMDSTGCPAGRAELLHDIVTFTLDCPTTQKMKDIMTQHGLPESFAEAVAHHASTRDRVLAALAQDPGKDQIPTSSRLMEAVHDTMDSLTQELLPTLKDLHTMAQNPPVKLNPPLTPETMPRYINALLALESAMAPLLRADAPMDTAFLQRLVRAAAAVQAGEHCMTGTLTQEGWNTLLQQSIQLFLARKGMAQKDIPGLVNRALDSFGALSRECCAMNDALKTGEFGEKGVALQKIGVTLQHMLQQISLSLMSCLTEEQLKALNLGTPHADRPAQEAAGGKESSVKDAPSAKPEETAVRGSQGMMVRNMFQRPTRPEEISPAVRSFALDHDVILPAGEHTASKLAQDNAVRVRNVLGEYIPRAGHTTETITPGFRTLLADLQARYPLASIDIDKLDVTRLAPALQSTLNELADEATRAGNAIDPEVIRAVVEEMLFHGLEALQSTLNAIDELPEQIVKDGMTTGFSAEEKAVLKECAQRFGIRDVKIITELAEGTRPNPMFNGGLIDFATPGLTPTQICEQGSYLSSRFQSTLRRLPPQFDGKQDALPMMMAMAVRLQHLSGDDVRRIADNMTSKATLQVAGGLQWALGRTTRERNAQHIRNTMDILSTLRTEANLAAHGSRPAPLRTEAARVSHPCEVVGGFNGIMQNLSSMSGDGISEVERELSKRMPPLTRGQWNALKISIETLGARAASSVKAPMLTHWIIAASDEILTAMQANGGAAPTTSQMWSILTGGQLGPMPPFSGSDDMAAMVDYIDKEYTRLVEAATDKHAPNADGGLYTNSSHLVPLRKMLELTRPGAHLTKDDVHIEMQHSSMKELEPANAYGLATDLYRLEGQSTLTFVRANGVEFSVHPPRLTTAESTADYHEYANIIQFWRRMTKSETQFYRLAHCCSQASFMIPRMLSSLFPGMMINEHGRFNIRAQERDDGSIIVNLDTADAAPLVLHEQIIIRPDGSHEYARFDMSRPDMSARTDSPAAGPEPDAAKAAGDTEEKKDSAAPTAETKEGTTSEAPTAEKTPTPEEAKPAGSTK